MGAQVLVGESAPSDRDDRPATRELCCNHLGTWTQGYIKISKDTCIYKDKDMDRYGYVRIQGYLFALLEGLI